MYQKVSILKEVNVTASNSSTPIGNPPNLNGITLAELLKANRTRNSNLAINTLLSYTNSLPPPKPQTWLQRKTAPFRRQWYRLTATYQYWKHY